MPHYSRFTFLRKSFQVSQAFCNACLHSLKNTVVSQDINYLWLISNTFLNGLYILEKAGTELVFLMPSHLWHTTFNNLAVVHPIKCASNHDITSKHVAEILNTFFVGYELGTGIESWIELTVILLCSHCSTFMSTSFGFLKKLDAFCRIDTFFFPRQQTTAAPIFVKISFYYPELYGTAKTDYEF